MHQLEKSTSTVVLAVVANISYASATESAELQQDRIKAAFALEDQDVDNSRFVFEPLPMLQVRDDPLPPRTNSAVILKIF